MNENLNYKAIAQLNRAYMAEVWRALREEPESLSDEQRLLADQMLAHEEYRETWENIAELGDYMFDPMREQNPFLHVSVHVALEKQIRSADPPWVRETLDRLVARGNDPHQARHAMLRVFVQEMWRVVTEGRPFDFERYHEGLERL